MLFYSVLFADVMFSSRQLPILSILVPAGAEQHCARPDTHGAKLCLRAESVQLPVGL